jgi:hypothetical protein
MSLRGYLDVATSLKGSETKKIGSRSVALSLAFGVSQGPGVRKLTHLVRLKRYGGLAIGIRDGA